MHRQAVFLDRDGTLNVEREYLSDPAKLEIYPGTGPALRRLMISTAWRRPSVVNRPNVLS